ncbi:helix-turn-helix domain-containing protein [uncultured Zhongshania sp.]|uniref:winged helix-turn-helix transcriptional regulator n=1 Tax=uncultured Zhongshania sp. TaxID=1642288 RepID=UPI0030D8A42B|tara:strand:- start:8178 stop:8663 length:486 start_codon:yes stop_codon:yes gene_type:complete
MQWEELGAQQCSVARSSVVLGDRWTLVILSDCFLGVRRFEDLQTRLQVSRTTLTQRLKKLEAHSVLERRAYQSNPARYEYRLTEKGRDLYPVISTLLNWGDKYYSDAAGPPILRQHQSCGHDIQPILCCPDCGEPIDPRQVSARKRPDAPGFAEVTRGPAR